MSLIQHIIRQTRVQMNITKIIYLSCGERYKDTHNLRSSGEDYLAVPVKLIWWSLLTAT